MKSATKKLSACERIDKAYFFMLEEMPYDKITVSQLIERAGVSRTTFYRHYLDIYDMYEKVCDRLINEFLKRFFFLSKGIDNLNSETLFDIFISVFKTQEKYINLLCGPHGGTYFFECVLNISTKNTDKFYFLSDKITDKDVFFIKFTTITAIAGYIKALAENQNTSNEILDACMMGAKIFNIKMENTNEEQGF